MRTGTRGTWGSGLPCPSSRLRNLVLVVPLGMLLAGCQSLVSSHPGPERVVLAAPELTSPHSAPFAMRSTAGPGGVQYHHVSSGRRTNELPVTDRQLAAELAVILRRAQRSGGPSYAGTDALRCATNAGPYRPLKAEEAICYVPGHGGRVAVFRPIR